MTDEGNSYRLLYFSPRPEDGERLCVGIVVAVGGRQFIEFDEHFAKVKSITRGHDVEVVSTSISELRADLGGRDLNDLMVGFEPQFSISPPRKLLVPWSDEVKTRLRRRFLLRGHQLPGATEKEHERQIETKLNTFISHIVPKAESNLIAAVRPSDLFGEDIARSFRNPKPITRALVSRTRAVLIDGVDTTVGDSTEIVQRANRIAFTFWQYGKLPRDLTDGIHRDIFKVGIVFDGAPKAKVLREYSLHQFTKDADLAIEAESGTGIEEVRIEIEKTLGDIKL